MKTLILTILIISGTALDVATTLYMVLLHGDRFAEANQVLQPQNLDLFLAGNAGFLAVCLIPILFVSRRSGEFFGHLRRYSFFGWLRKMSSEEEDSSLESTQTHASYFAYLRSIDILVTIVALACALNLMRVSAGINNLVLLFFGEGFIGPVINLFPSIHIQVLVHIFAGLTTLLCFPLSYFIMRKIALAGSRTDEDSSQ